MTYTQQEQELMKQYLDPTYRAEDQDPSGRYYYIEKDPYAYNIGKTSIAGKTKEQFVSTILADLVKAQKSVDSSMTTSQLKEYNSDLVSQIEAIYDKGGGGATTSGGTINYRRKNYIDSRLSDAILHMRQTGGTLVSGGASALKAAQKEMAATPESTPELLAAQKAAAQPASAQDTQIDPTTGLTIAQAKAKGVAWHAPTTEQGQAALAQQTPPATQPTAQPATQPTTLGSNAVAQQQTSTLPASTYAGPSIVDYLKSVGQPSDYASRAKMAQQYGVTNYTGTAEQNTQLLGTLRGAGASASQQPTAPATSAQQASTPTTSAQQPIITGQAGGATQYQETKIPSAEMSNEEISTSVKGLAEAGVDWKTIQSYLDAITLPEKSKAELTTEMYDKYGISDLEEKYASRPTETFEDIYKTIYESLDLAGLKAKIVALTDKLGNTEKEYTSAVGDINENPWISEAGRVGKIAKLSEQYEMTRSNINNQLTLLNNMEERGKSEAEKIATRTLEEFSQQKEWDKEELAYYLQRAEADVEAEMNLAEQNKTSQLLRYLPEYVSSLPKEQKEVDTQIIEVAGRKVLVNTQTGDIIKDLGVVSTSGSTTATTWTQLNKLGYSRKRANDGGWNFYKSGEPITAQEISEEVGTSMSTLLAGSTNPNDTEYLKEIKEGQGSYAAGFDDL